MQGSAGTDRRDLHRALKVEDSRRAAFLRQTCSGDENLLLELERLLALQSQARDFLESPAVEVGLGSCPGPGAAPMARRMQSLLWPAKRF